MTFTYLVHWLQKKKKSFRAYSGKFSRGRNFRDFCDQTPAREICFNKKFSSKTFLLRMSRALLFRAADPVNRQKIDLFVVEDRANCGNFSQSMINSSVVTATANRSRVSSLLLAWQFFADSDRHALVSVVTSYSTLNYTLRVTISKRKL